jgi:hypothetical protein
MTRLLFTILVCGVTSSPATAQNKASQTLSGLSEDQRNETFTYLLRDNNVKCDQVIHTLFNGRYVEAGCVGSAVPRPKFVLAQYFTGSKGRY